MDGQNWRGLRWIDLGKFEKRRPTFIQIYVSLYQNIIYTAGKSFSVVMWPWFCKWKTLALPIWRLELIIGKIKQNYLKYRDLAPSANVFSTVDVCTIFFSKSPPSLQKWNSHLSLVNQISLTAIWVTMQQSSGAKPHSTTSFPNLTTHCYSCVGPIS